MHDRRVRWLILSIVLAGSGLAEAERLVISDPPTVRACPRGKTWGAVMGCLSKQGTVKVVKEVRGGKLVRLTQPAGRGYTNGTVVLYVERKGEWQIGGLHQSYGEFEILGIEPLTVGKHAGFRIDVGQVSPYNYSVDNISPVSAQLRTRQSLFCGGDSYSCAAAVTSCEVSVGGRGWFVFRGTIAIADNAVLVKGDRSRAGTQCAVSEKVYLGWTQPP